MKALLLAACLLTLPGGDRDKGLQLYGEGRFADAAAAFRSAIESEGDSADLQWNLALASWRAGDLVTAETAAEKYAAMTTDARVDLHRGLLGAVRHGEAKLFEAEADTLLGGAPPAAAAAPAAQPPPQPLPLLERALEKALQARDHFVAAAAAKASPELLRNVERTLRYTEELQKKIDELKKQQQQQQDEKKDDQQQKDDQQKKDEQQKGDQQKKDEQQKQDDPQQQPKDQSQKKDEPQDQQQPPQQGEERPEPKADDPSQQSGEQGSPEPKPADKAPEPKPEDNKRSDAPGEAAEGKELSPEQAQRLLEQLKDLDQRLKSIRARAKSGRRPVERDW